MKAVTRKVIRVDGTVEELASKMPLRSLAQTIGADTLDTVPMRHMGSPLHVMLVDDCGVLDGKPVNEEATKLYLANCRHGTTHSICGDVVIVPDGDFA